MPLSPKELKLFKEHLNKTMVCMTCPCCEGQQWDMDGPLLLLGNDIQAGKAIISNTGQPCVTMTCMHCFYIRHFAWMPIFEGRSKK